MKYLFIKIRYLSREVSYYVKKITHVDFKFNYLSLLTNLILYFLYVLLFVYLPYKKCDNIFVFYNLFLIVNIIINCFKRLKVDNILINSFNFDLNKYTKSVYLYETLIDYFYSLIVLLILKFDVFTCVLLSFVSAFNMLKYIKYKKIFVFVSTILVLPMIFHYYIINSLFPITVLMLIINFVFYIFIGKVNLNKIYNPPREIKLNIQKKLSVNRFNKLVVYRNKDVFYFQFFVLLLSVFSFIILYYYSDNNIVMLSIQKFFNNKFYLLVLLMYLLNNINLYEAYYESDKIMNEYSFYRSRNKKINIDRFIINVIINSLVAVIVCVALYILNMPIYNVMILFILNIVFSIYHYFIYRTFNFKNINIIYNITFFIIFIIGIA